MCCLGSSAGPSKLLLLLGGVEDCSAPAKKPQARISEATASRGAARRGTGILESDFLLGGRERNIRGVLQEDSRSLEKWRPEKIQDEQKLNLTDIHIHEINCKAALPPKGLICGKEGSFQFQRCASELN
jgi:hypothetical protein